MTDIEYEAKISQYSRSDLLNLWQAIEAGDASGWEPGRALEYLILRNYSIFLRNKYDTGLSINPKFIY
jgi:hypothetical protein